MHAIPNILQTHMLTGDENTPIGEDAVKISSYKANALNIPEDGPLANMPDDAVHKLPGCHSTPSQGHRGRRSWRDILRWRDNGQPEGRRGRIVEFYDRRRSLNI